MVLSPDPRVDCDVYLSMMGDKIGLGMGTKLPNKTLQATLGFAFLFFLDPQPSAPEFFR